MNTDSVNTETTGIPDSRESQKTQLLEVLLGPMAMPLRNILDLPIDIVLLVFNLLSPHDLSNLRLVCRSFRDISDSESIWFLKKKKLAFRIEHQSSQLKFNSISSPGELVSKSSTSGKNRISSKQIYITTQRWSTGRYVTKTVSKFHKKQLPELRLRDRTLWLSAEASVSQYRMNARLQPGATLRSQRHRDITAIDVSSALLVAADDGGCVLLCEPGSEHFNYQPWEQQPLRCVATAHNVVITGCRGPSIKIGRVGEDRTCLHEVGCVRHEHRKSTTWTLDIKPDLSSFVSGSNGEKAESALKVWDMETLGCTPLHVQGVGRQPAVFQARFESEHTLLACGYDAVTRRWDLRTQTCVQAWTEPFNSSVYCFATDGGDALLTGTSRHAMARLWDMRRPDRHIQIYYVEAGCTSPIYSLVWTSELFVAALDRSVQLVDFWRCGPNVSAHDYSFFK